MIGEADTLTGGTFTPDVRLAPDGECICWCAGVTKGRIVAAIRAGAGDLDRIKTATGACVAGKCKEMNPRGR